jgi:hypothetical protein
MSQRVPDTNQLPWLALYARHSYQGTNDQIPTLYFHSTHIFFDVLRSNNHIPHKKDSCIQKKVIQSTAHLV